MLYRSKKMMFSLGLMISGLVVISGCSAGAPRETPKRDQAMSKSASSSRNASFERPSADLDDPRHWEMETRRYPRQSVRVFIGTRMARRVDLDFGWFNYRRTTDWGIEVEPFWRQTNLVAISCPHAGGEMTIWVHRAARPYFEKAFRLIREKHLQHLVHVASKGNASFQARFMRSPKARKSSRMQLSRHSWGLAIDINSNLPSGKSRNRRLWKEAFKPAGFTWGESFRDPMHFEIAGTRSSRQVDNDSPGKIRPSMPRPLVDPRYVAAVQNKILAAIQ